MHTHTLLFSLGFTVLVTLLQWWATRLFHRKRLARTHARYVKAQQSADKLLQQSRHQNLQLQQELAAARLAVKRTQREQAPARSPSLDARNALMKILDEAPAAKRALPIDGFAETMPSLQFPSSAMGSL